MKTKLFTAIGAAAIGLVCGLWLQSARNARSGTHEAGGAPEHSPTQAQSRQIPGSARATSGVDGSRLRLQDTQRVIEREYGRALTTLDLPPEIQRSIKEILVDWVQDQITFNIQGAGRANKSPSTDPASGRRAINELAQRRLSLLLDQPRLDQLKEMMADRLNYHLIEYGYSFDFAFAGCPLSAQQVVALANVLGMEQAKHHDDPRRQELSTTVPDPKLGLSMLDIEMVDRASSLLGDRQLDVFKSNLRIQTSAFVASKNRKSGAATMPERRPISGPSPIPLESRQGSTRSDG